MKTIWSPENVEYSFRIGSNMDTEIWVGMCDGKPAYLVNKVYSKEVDGVIQLNRRCILALVPEEISNEDGNN